MAVQRGLAAAAIATWSMASGPVSDLRASGCAYLYGARRGSFGSIFVSAVVLGTDRHPGCAMG